jgi:hypothetical protein
MTKKFEYTDIDGIKKEAETFISSEFVTTSAPNSPVMTKANGLLDPSIIPPTAVGKSASLVIDRIASGTILRGDVVKASTTNHVSIADPTSDLDSASGLGVALNDADDSEPVEVLILGIISDPIFNVFSVNEVLFLDEAGGITNVKPTKPSRNFLLIIGKSLGGNEVFVNLQSPITLGV